MLTKHAFPSQVFTMKTQKDHANPLLIFSGSDSMTQIGEPQGGRRGGSMEQLWAEAVDQYFPRNAEKAEAQDLSIGDLSKYPE